MLSFSFAILICKVFIVISFVFVALSVRLTFNIYETIIVMVIFCKNAKDYYYNFVNVKRLIYAVKRERMMASLRSLT